jgi:crotonobetainyl-CoA:carnitine CoA-transferase CaiB-like acyl-CoA transferase
MAKLGGVLPIAPVYEMSEALDSPFVAGRLVANVPHPARPDMRMLVNPIKINGQRLAQKACPPVGADNEAVLGPLAGRKVV